MRSFIISSALLVVLVQCGYPVAEDTYPTVPPSYPVPRKEYPTVPPTYPVPQKQYPVVAPSIPTEYTSSFNDNENEVETATDSGSVDYRKRAKARTAQNRQFQRRALQPIRRFQQKRQ